MVLVDIALFVESHGCGHFTLSHVTMAPLSHVKLSVVSVELTIIILPSMPW